VKGNTGEAFILESLIPPQGIPPLCDDPGLWSAVLAWLPTLDESGVAIRQTGGRDPHRGSIFSVYRPEVPSPPMLALELPLRPLAPRTRAKGLRAALPLGVPPGGRRERGDTDCAAPMGLLSRIRPLIRTPPEASEDSWQGQGGRLPGLGRAEACQSSNTTTIRPAATSTAATIGLTAATPGAATAAAVGAANIPLPGSLKGPGPQVSVAFFTGLAIMSTGINPSFAHQGLFSFCIQSRASPASGCYRRDSATGPPGSSCGSGCSGANTRRCRSDGGGPHCPDGCHSLNDGDVVDYTVGSGRGGPSRARRHYRGRRRGRIQLQPTAHSGGDGGDFRVAAPIRRRARSGADSPLPGVVSRPSGPPRDWGGDPEGVGGA
jgi:hypothetical protein